MRKLIVGEFITMDGVIQAPGGVDEDRDGGFAHGSWTIPFWHDDIGGYFVKSMEDCDTFLLGRKTWQTHGEAFDPMPAGDFFGDIMNSKKKYVVSTTLKSACARPKRSVNGPFSATTCSSSILRISTSCAGWSTSARPVPTCTLSEVSPKLCWYSRSMPSKESCVTWR